MLLSIQAIQHTWTQCIKCDLLRVSFEESKEESCNKWHRLGLACPTPDGGVRLGVVLGGGGWAAAAEASEEKEKERRGADGPAAGVPSACRDSPGDRGWVSEPLKLLPALPGGPWLKLRLNRTQCGTQHPPLRPSQHAAQMCKRSYNNICRQELAAQSSRQRVK